MRAAAGCLVRPGLLAPAAGPAQHQQHQRRSLPDALTDDIRLRLQSRHGLPFTGLAL